MWLDYRFGGTRTSSEQFNCAGRTILTGLIAVDIVSHWCVAPIISSCGKGMLENQPKLLLR